MTDSSQATAKTTRDIIAEERAAHAAYEATTVAGIVNGIEYTIASFRAISGAFFDETDWKRPWEGRFSTGMVPLVRAITEFYHGDIPEVVATDAWTDTVTLRGHGYQC
jgi:hypothetical protein